MKIRPLSERIRIRPVRRGNAKPEVAKIARAYATAEPTEQILVEREGIPALYMSYLAEAMEVPRVRLFEIWNLPRASMEKKIADEERLSGRANRQTLNTFALIGKAQEIVADSTAAEAKDFDVAGWLGRWIETPQPALGGKCPSELLDTEVGTRMVERTLGALRSGAYL